MKRSFESQLEPAGHETLTHKQLPKVDNNANLVRQIFRYLRALCFSFVRESGNMSFSKFYTLFTTIQLFRNTNLLNILFGLTCNNVLTSHHMNRKIKLKPLNIMYTLCNFPKAAKAVFPNFFQWMFIQRYTTACLHGFVLVFHLSTSNAPSELSPCPEKDLNPIREREEM